MGSAIDRLAIIRKLFQGREDLVERNFWSDPDFRTLCNDYQTCLDTLERLRRENSPDALRRRREYAELLDELAGDIRSWSDERPSGKRER